MENLPRHEKVTKMINALKDLANSDRPCTFLLTNKGRRLVQVLRTEDINKWGTSVKFDTENGVIISLVFNDKAREYGSDHKRFLSSSIYDDFYEVNIPSGPGGKTFFLDFLTPINFLDIQEVIHRIIEDVYNLSLSNDEFEWGLMRF